VPPHTFKVISNPSPPVRPSRASTARNQDELQLMGALMSARSPQAPAMTPSARSSMEKAIRWQQHHGRLNHGALIEFLL
jgi:hypothetical protein